MHVHGRDLKCLGKTVACIFGTEKDAEQVVRSVYEISTDCLVSLLTKSAFHLTR